MIKVLKDGYNGRMPETCCPSCFTILDAVTSLDGKNAPKTGDYTICIACANLMRFDENMQLVSASLMDIPVEHRLNFAQGVQAVKTMRGL